MPLHVSAITNQLFVSSLPAHADRSTIQTLEPQLLISIMLSAPPPSIRTLPSAWLHLRAVDSPLLPLPISLLTRGVEAALPILQRGGRVLVHCRYGIHRSAALACCILIALGSEPHQSIQIVRKRRPVARPDAWYVAPRIHKFAAAWSTGAAGSAAA